MVPAVQVKWEVVRAVLFVADLYNFLSYKDDAVRLLDALFPTGIASVDKLRSEPSTCPVLLERAEDTISLANLARTICDLQRVRFRALYDCAQLPASQLLGGVVQADGTIATLSPEDTARCIEARRRLTARHIRLLNQMAEDLTCPSHDAGQRKRCAMGRRSAVNKLFEDVSDWHAVLQPKQWDTVLVPNTSQFNVCQGCRTGMVDTFNEGRQDTLDNMASYFELSSEDS